MLHENVLKKLNFDLLTLSNFWPQGDNLNKLGRCPLGEATYQISRLYALCFQTRRYVMFFSVQVYVKHVIPWARPVLAQGA